jgi:uncharacterized protein DUF1572
MTERAGAAAGPGARHLEDVLLQFRKYKTLAEQAASQVSDAQFVQTLDPEANSIALVMKHLAGNMRSRWRDFLTSDGEKPDRDRDREFVLEPGETRARVMAQWEEGWRLLFAAIEPLRPADLERTVPIRGEPHTVLQAINRQLTHYVYHIGQIVFIAKHLAGERWKTLSVPRGMSRDYEVTKEGRPYWTTERPG